jgi:hypothetical protein
MSMPESIRALRGANPRNDAGFAESVEAATLVVRSEIAGAVGVAAPSRRSRRRLIGLSAVGAAAVAATALVAFSTIGSSGVPNATAAFKKATTLTAASAERSGTAVVRITHEGKPWAASTIRWHGDDIVVASDLPQRAGRPGSPLVVVNGVVYAVENGHWVAMGSPKNIDPGSGTTPDEYLAALREDVGGPTLRRVTDGMTGLTTRTLADGSTAYSGSVAAGLIARESGFKEGHTIRVLPFGFVAHDEAADSAAPLETTVTVGSDGIVREVLVEWGTWVFDVSYRNLGATAAPQAPVNAIPLSELRK